MNKGILSAQDQYDLQQHEVTIKKGMDVFLEVGSALTDIRDRRLYRATHKTFESYCRSRWNWSKTHCNRLISSAVVAQNLGPMGVKITKERHARPLAKLDTPEQQQRAYTRATDKAQLEGREPTAKDISTAVEEELGTRASQGTAPKPKDVKPPKEIRWSDMAISYLESIDNLSKYSCRSKGFRRVFDYIIRKDKTGNLTRTKNVYKALASEEQEKFVEWANQTVRVPNA